MTSGAFGILGGRPQDAAHLIGERLGLTVTATGTVGWVGASASSRQRPASPPIVTSQSNSSIRRLACKFAASRSAIKRADHGRKIAPASPRRSRGLSFGLSIVSSCRTPEFVMLAVDRAAGEALCHSGKCQGGCHDNPIDCARCGDCQHDRVFVGPSQAAPQPSPVTPELVEAAKRKARSSTTRRSISRSPKVWPKSLRAEISRHHGAGRAHRQRAPLPARITRACQQDLHRRRLRRNRSGLVRRMEEAGRTRARLFRPRSLKWPAARTRSRWRLFQRALHADADRLQHQSGQAGGGAKKLCRSARSEMVRQNGEGAPELFGAAS